MVPMAEISKMYISLNSFNEYLSKIGIPLVEEKEAGKMIASCYDPQYIVSIVY